MSVYEEIEYLKPDGMKMSAFIAQLVEAGMKKPETHEERAAREVELNAAYNNKQYEEMTRDDRKDLRDGRGVSQLGLSNMTFNEIIAKHKEELEKKYK